MKKRLTVLAALLTCSTLMGSVHVYAEENEKNVVETAYGKVQGINSVDENYEDVVEFRGIPYAAPPVDDLRWKPPVDPEKWDDVLVCDTYKDIPMQVLGGAEVEPYKTDIYYDGVPKMSEDCLYLNVMTTEDSLSSTEKKPYLSLPQLSEEQGQSGNYGLMDQIKAMEWIKENIANFGGDPENITVGGQSGGTTKAMAMTASPKMDVEVDKLILESGLKYNMEFQTQESAEEKGTAYLGDLGLDEATTLEDLRNMDAEKLIDSTSSNYPGSMNLDGLYVTYESIQDSINDGVFDEISVLSGTNMGEGSYPKVSTADDFYAQYKEALGDLYDKYDFENLVKVDDNTAAMVSRQLGTYGLGTNVSRSLMVNRLYGKTMSERTDGKAVNYTYLFSHATPESMSDLGTDRGWANQWAWHTGEMWYAFNSLREGVPAVRQWTDWDYELAEKMNQYWSNFIKTGDPNGDGLAYWPEADENMGYIQLGDGISTHDEELTDLEKLMMDYTTNYFNFPVAD